LVVLLFEGTISRYYDQRNNVFVLSFSPYPVSTGKTDYDRAAPVSSDDMPAAMETADFTERSLFGEVFRYFLFQDITVWVS
jgi:hypothetical protein